MMTKKANVFFLMSIILILTVPLPGQEWSNPILISGGDTPDLDIDLNTGNLYVLSMVNGVTLTKLSSEGVILEQEIVPGASDDKGGSNFGATLAVDSQGFPHVCYRHYDGDDPDGTPTYTAYYIRKTAAGWQEPIQLSKYVRRGYVIRIDVDENDIAHVVQGFIFDEPESIWGYVRYFRIKDNILNRQQVLGIEFPYIFRGDDRIEITTRPGGYIFITSGVPDPNGKVYYLISTDRGNSFTSLGDIHHSQCLGRNGSPDLATDTTGAVHICYGASQDESRRGLPSVRYARFFQNAKVMDKAATPEKLLVDWKIGMGLGSIAINATGEEIVIAFSEKPGGRLYTTLSKNSGETWESPVEVAPISGSNEGRNRHLIRSNDKKFYLVYPQNNNIYLRKAIITLNQLPIADAGGPYAAGEGTVIHFEASKSIDPDGTIQKYEWDWNNDGIFDSTSSSAQFDYTYIDDYIGKMKLRVTDNKGETSTDLADVNVTNINPTADAGGPYHGIPNENIQCHGKATDPGLHDILTYQWDLDFNGNFETNGMDILAKFTAGGKYKIVLRVADDDGGVGLDTAIVDISSEPPVVSPIPHQTVTEGSPFNPIHLDNYVADPDNSDDQIIWQVSGNKNLAVTINASRIATITSINPDWFGAENLTFIAIDPSQFRDSTITTFTITNVNDPPVISQIPAQTTNEGESFAPIKLDDFVHDSDNASTEISWSIKGNIQLSYTIQNRVLTVVPLNSEWFGSELLSILATDLGGLSDTISVIFTVKSVNDPPVVSDIPGQQKRVGQDFTPITLDNYVSDADHRDEEMKWTRVGNKYLKVDIANRVARITRPNPTWIGSDTISFIATDPLGASDTSRTVFISLAKNQPPVVNRIPDQTILEGQSFQPIYLDGFVTDPDNRDEEIIWKISGYNRLIVTTANRVVTIKAPDENWNGNEIINFRATDPEGLSDSSLTRFTIIAVNDPPVLAKLPDFQFNEDDTLKWTFSYLRTLVTDPDNKPEDFQFKISQNVHLLWLNDLPMKQVCIFGQPNWYGEETITLSVLDGRGGSDSEPCKIKVISIPDPPMRFSVIYPVGNTFSAAGDTIRFLWRKAHDPEGGRPMYQLNIADAISFTHVIDQFNNLLDTSFVYVTQPSLAYGNYYWKIVAFNRVGFTESNLGLFSISKTGIISTDRDAIPADFALLPNYPNPFNPQTGIVYQLPKRSFIKIEIYNSMGQRVAILEDSEKNAGTHKIIWNAINPSGERLPSGVYLCHLKTDRQSFMIKMLLLH